MSENEIFISNANDNSQDNMILPFSFDRSAVRGRIARLGSVLRDILDPHDYPEPVAQLVAEAAALTLLLGGMLKYEGVFTLQASGDGPVRMLVCDLTSAGELRAVAHYDRAEAEQIVPALAKETSVQTLRPHDRALDLKTLMGNGHLAFTVDQGDQEERYQGIVALDGPQLSDCVQHYFDQSEQIETTIRIAVGRVAEDGWRAGGVMIQRLPLAEQDKTQGREEEVQDDWDRALALLSTCTPDELLSVGLLATDLLYRLFHEEDVRAYTPLYLRKGCRCYTEKLMGILKTMSPDDLAHMTIDGHITMTCAFCAKDFVFVPNELSPPEKGEV
jgi:molecular chaperone Hsp33